MKRFEYKVVSQPEFLQDINEEDLNSFGKDGWELVFWSSFCMVFKREYSIHARTRKKV